MSASVWRVIRRHVLGEELLASRVIAGDSGSSWSSPDRARWSRYCALKLVHAAHDADEDLLRRFFSVFAATEQPQSPPIDHRAVLSEQGPDIGAA